ncbi:hypothetical protein GCM10010489_37580 [Microbacterium saperdae]|nr:hypothetical protein GCM10010489_37580 [Microbacterium saperdae]
MSAPIEADRASISDPITGVVLMLTAAFAPCITYKFLSFVGFDMYHSMSSEQEAKSALNRPVPVPASLKGDSVDGGGDTSGKPTGGGSGGCSGPTSPPSGAPAATAGTATPAVTGGAGAGAGAEPGQARGRVRREARSVRRASLAVARTWTASSPMAADRPVSPR